MNFRFISGHWTSEEEGEEEEEEDEEEEQSFKLTLRQS